ncbi:MAG TPA: hypothetical protein PLG43_03250 [Spirochaetia bacterium]|nr:hypothetical protein [Spirochaetia bacterium]
MKFDTIIAAIGDFINLGPVMHNHASYALGLLVLSTGKRICQKL